MMKAFAKRIPFSEVNTLSSLLLSGEGDATPDEALLPDRQAGASGGEKEQAEGVA